MMKGLNEINHDTEGQQKRVTFIDNPKEDNIEPVIELPRPT